MGIACGSVAETFALSPRSWIATSTAGESRTSSESAEGQPEHRDPLVVRLATEGIDHEVDDPLPAAGG